MGEKLRVIGDDFLERLDNPENTQSSDAKKDEMKEKDDYVKEGLNKTKEEVKEKEKVENKANENIENIKEGIREKKEEIKEKTKENVDEVIGD